MKTYLVTGASRGLGLAICHALAKDPEHHVVLAVRDLTKGEAAAKRIGKNAEAMRLDCASQKDLARFISAWRPPLAGLINNAGVQLVGATKMTADQREETLAVNHLAALQLTIGLLPQLRGGRVLFIGSGTHNPNNKTATMFGFRGARFTNIEALAHGESDAKSDPQRGRDRYATSKLLNIVTARALAVRIPATETTFYTLDPGLMAGTGLARSAPRIARLLWSTVLRWASPLLPDSSTPERSAEAARWLLTAPTTPNQNGEVFSYEKKLSTRVWSRASDPELGRAVLEQSLALLQLELP